MNYKLAKVGLIRRYKPLYNPQEPIAPGTSVKLIFRLTKKNADTNAERLWVTVTDVSSNGRDIEGEIDNDPLYVDLKYGDGIRFKKENIFDIDNS